MTRSAVLALIFLLAFQGVSKSQQANEATEDCAPTEVDYLDNARLTPSERLALMDAALERSLNRFDECQTEKTEEASNDDPNGGGQGAGARAGGGSSGGSGSGEGSGASVAASDISGTENASAAPGETSQGANQGSEGSPQSQQGSQQGETSVSASNGKVPEDIPAADNDSVLEAQIRRAAETEPDPEVRARLWDEYRKYKGLPLKGNR